MAITSGNSDGPDIENLYRLNGIFPEAIEEFNERLPELQHGDFIIGGALREDFKDFVYSGLVSEFPYNGETVFVVTERGEETWNSEASPEDIVEQEGEFGLEDAPELLKPSSDPERTIEIVEHFTSRYRAELEHYYKNLDQPAWKRYVDLGTDVLNQWEEVHSGLSGLEDETAEDYRDLLEGKLDGTTQSLIRLADSRSNSDIEQLRSHMYEMESLTDYLE